MRGRPDPYSDAASAAAVLATACGIDRIEVVVVLGSGWSSAAEALGPVLADIPYDAIPGFVPPAAPGHRGHALMVELAGQLVLVLQGRTRIYEDYGPAAVAHPVRTAAALGARLAVLTSANGCLRDDLPPGTIMVIRDHVNPTGITPLIGPRFVDLTACCDPVLRSAAADADPQVVEGVYLHRLAELAGLPAGSPRPGEQGVGRHLERRLGLREPRRARGTAHRLRRLPAAVLSARQAAGVRPGGARIRPHLTRSP